MNVFEGMNQQELMRRFAEFLAKEGATTRVTFRDLWVKYQAYGSSRTDGGRTRIKSWEANNRPMAAKLLHFFGDLPWDECTLSKAEEYRQWRSSLPKTNGRGTAPVKAASRNRELRTVAACLSYARKLGVIPRNPMTGLADEQEIHDREFSLLPDQTLKIMKASRPKLRFILLLLNETGMRRGEVLALEWAEVDLVGGFINLPKHKTKANKDRQIPLSVAAMAVLEMIESDGHNPFVFPNPNAAQGHLHPRTVWRWFKEAREKAGVSGPKGQAIWMHTYRHTFATDQATGGMDIQTLMNICGWTDQKIVMKYVNIAKRHREAAKVQMDLRGADQRDQLMGLMGRAPARKAPVVTSITTTPEDAEPTAGKKAVG